MPASFPAALKSFGTAHQDFTENILAAHVNDLQDEVVAIEGNLGVLPNQGQDVLGATQTYATVKARMDAQISAVRTHTHDGTQGVKLVQANSHQSPDTDTAAGSLHHTIGSSATQAAAGNHTHTQATSHSSPDTDANAAALHHTIGSGANQAAAGNHSHSAQAGEAVGAGSVLMWTTASAPAGYLLCDGSAVSRTTYATLFGVIGVVFGNGNGSTTFNVPDFRSRVPIGAGTGSGLTARTLAATGGAQDAVVPSHTHTGSSAGASANHQHDVSHGHTAGSGTESSDHQHYIYGSDFGGLGGGGSLVRLGYNGGGGNLTGGRTAAHTHGISVDPNYFSSGFQSADHSHGVTVNAAGVSVTDARMNPWLAINFIIKT